MKENISSAKPPCEREARWWWRLRWSPRCLIETMIPSCCHSNNNLRRSYQDYDDEDVQSYSSSSMTKVTGTIYGERKGRVVWCVQEDPKGAPLMLVEMGVTTGVLAREMSQGLLKISLECERKSCSTANSALVEVPVWTMYCNGRKCGFAVRHHQPSEIDLSVLRALQLVSAGAGVIPKGYSKNGEEIGEITYMRASYERVVGSADSESFHLVNPSGTGNAQQLSIFLVRN